MNRSLTVTKSLAPGLALTQRANRRAQTKLIVITAIAGIYGMNFKFMPELEWRYGYFVILGLMTVISLGLYFYFKKKGHL